MKLFFFILLSSLSSLLYSQVAHRDTISPIDSKCKIIVANVLAPLSPEIPRVRVGYIHGFHKRFMVGLSVGFADFGMYNKRYEDYEFLELRPEFYFNFGFGEESVHYFSLEIFNIWHHEIMRSSAYYDGNEEVYYSSTNYERSRVGYHIKYGMITKLGENFGFNWYIGLGEAVTNNNYYNTKKVDQLRTIPPLIYGNKIGRNKSISMALGFRFFYEF